MSGLATCHSVRVVLGVLYIQVGWVKRWLNPWMTSAIMTLGTFDGAQLLHEHNSIAHQRISNQCHLFYPSPFRRVNKKLVIIVWRFTIEIQASSEMFQLVGAWTAGVGLWAHTLLHLPLHTPKPPESPFTIQILYIIVINPPAISILYAIRPSNNYIQYTFGMAIYEQWRAISSAK